jgi:hypothetical protein
MTFTLSIEQTPGKSVQYGYHLGSDLRLARIIVQEKMAAYLNYGLPVVTMALKRNHKIVDVLYRDGTWHNNNN